jgi:hypothetical protein
MNSTLQAGLAVVAAVIGLAVVAVFVSKNSQTPAVFTAAGSSLAQVIAAAVNPAATAHTNGNPGLSTFTTPNVSQLATNLSGLFPA